MTMYSRDAADRLLLVARRAAETVKIESAHLAELAETIIALYDRLDAPPRIIRTRDELANLDPDTMLLDVDDPRYEVHMSASEWMEDYTIDAEGIFPLAVIATGEQVRAARQALEAGE